MSRFHYIVLTVIFQREKDGRWRAKCKELGTSTFANTFDEIQEDIKEAIELHLNTLEEVGERDRFFKEHNIELKTSRPPKYIPLNVPINVNTCIQPFIQPISIHTHRIGA